MQFGTAGDVLKPFDEVQMGDPRQSAFIVLDPVIGAWRRKTVDDHYRLIARLALNDAVPRDVRTLFDTARNLLLYSWYVYRFIPAAELQAYATVEYAIKKRAKMESVVHRDGLKQLLTLGVERGWIVDRGFKTFERREKVRHEYVETMRLLLGRDVDVSDSVDPQSYARQLADAVPILRNDLAHGSETLSSEGYLILEICCDLLNQVFPTSASASQQST